MIRILTTYAYFLNLYTFNIKISEWKVGIMMTVQTKCAQFPENILFYYPWRTYQQRILDELDEHLANRHLHLVAPPGSGKTVLGLEVMLRLNKPTIILAPTLTIKNQWEQRFTELFLQQNKKPDWISMHIKEPAFVTITTYQSLYSLYRAAEEEAAETTIEEVEGQKEIVHSQEVHAIFEKLDALQFQTIILDEAHHLRTAWWKATMDFRNRLYDYTTIALTATPPYDVSIQEWERYEQLCGPIDAEIHVAELVREQDLCAHQDYVYLSLPEKAEQERLELFYQQISHLQEQLMQDVNFKRAITEHPWMTSPEQHIEAILNDPEFYSSMLIFLHHVQLPLHDQALTLLALEEAHIPPMTTEWMEILLNGLRQDNHIKEHKQFDLERFMTEVKQIGALERGRIYLQSTPQTDRRLLQNVSKLESIEQIAKVEYDHLGDQLRMVILTDYIRKEMLDSENPGHKLGVVPIFQLLHRRLPKDCPIAVLTGSLVIIPKTVWPHLEALAKEKRINISCKTLASDEDFVSVDVTQQNRTYIVAFMTALFTDGHVQVLIGTAALLGEGWDAPCINALIMASYVSSFMLSNQMRGRAIRMDPQNTQKTSSIWHLLCVDPFQPDSGYDRRLLRRRFRSLVGLHAYTDIIETGFNRLGAVATKRLTTENIQDLNEDTCERARNRAILNKRWKEAVYTEDAEQEVQLRVEQLAQEKPIVYPYTIKALLYGVYYIFLGFFYDAMSAASQTPNSQTTRIVILILFIIAAVTAAPNLLLTMKMILRYRSLEKYMKTIGEVLYESLHDLSFVETSPKDIQIHVEDVEGVLTCSVRGGKMYEKNLLMDAWGELLDPVQNPRYVLRRFPKKVLGFRRKADYLAVPTEIGKRKEDAEAFCQKWNQQIERATVHYTRTPEGREYLIKARADALIMNFLDPSERVSVWK